MLELRNLHVSYGRIRALRGVDLDVPEGSAVALLGPNGAGKTSLLSAVSGLVSTDRSSEIRLGGEDLRSMKPFQIARRGLVHIPEGRGIFTGLSVRDNLEVASKLHNGADPAGVLARFPQLSERLDQVAGTLSGGEQQMLAVSLALMAQPRVLLIDELSLGLAPVVVKELFVVLHQLKTEGMTILLVEQFVHQALQLADHAYVLYRGNVVFSGPASSLEGSDVEKAYLGGGTGGADSESDERLSTSSARPRPASTRLSVNIRAEEARRLEREAERRGIPIDRLLREAVEGVVASSSDHLPLAPPPPARGGGKRSTPLRARRSGPVHERDGSATPIVGRKDS